MQAKRADDEEVRQLIMQRMEELGVKLGAIVEQNLYLAVKIEKGDLDDPTLYKCLQVLGLITYKDSSGEMPSRDAMMELLSGTSPRTCQPGFVEWGCNGDC